MKAIIKNGLALTVIRLVTLFFPLLVIPLLITRIGLEGYGKVAFMTAFFSYFIIVVSYGFEESATKKIAAGFLEAKEERYFLINVVSIKIALSFALYTALVICWLYFNFDWIYLVFGLVVFSEAINPLWYFLGIQKIHVVSVSTAVAKILYLLSVFVVINGEADIYLVPILIVSSSIIANIYPLYTMFSYKNLSFTECSLEGMKRVFVQSIPVFITNFIPTLKDKIGTVVIGYYFSLSVVAIFDVILKVLIVLQIPINILNSAFFPFLSKKKEYKYILLLFLLSLSYAVCAFFVVWFSAEYVITEFYSEYISYIVSIKIISSSIIFYSVSLAIAKNIFIILGQYKLVVFSILLSTFFYLIGLGGLIHYKYLSVLSLCTLTTITFLFEMLVRLIFLSKNSIINDFRA